MDETGSRWRHFLLMLPFFVIGVAIPVYFFGFSGDGPPKLPDNSYHPIAPAPSYAPNDSTGYGPPGAPDGYGTPPDDGGSSPIVSFTRSIFDDVVNTYVSPNLSPLTIKLGLLAVLFVGGFIVLRIALAAVTGALGGFFSFLVHKAAGPMFMGFMAVGSTWGIHQTIAQQFGLTWAAATVSLTAAIATLFALAGVKLR